METIGRNVTRLRLEAGWTRRLDAYDATVNLVADGKIAEPITPDEWSRIERPKGPKGPTLVTLRRVSAALSAGLGRRVTLDEIVTGSRYVLAPDEPDAAIVDELDRGTAASRRRRRGTRRPNGEKRRES